MTDNDRFAGHRLLETGTLVEFSIVKESVDAGPDDGEFAVRVDLVFTAEDDEGIEAEDIAEWGAFGFIFVLGVLSFADGRPRESSIIDYAENDEFGVSDLLEHLRFRHSGGASFISTPITFEDAVSRPTLSCAKTVR